MFTVQVVEKEIHEVRIMSSIFSSHSNLLVTKLFFIKIFPYLTVYDLLPASSNLLVVIIKRTIEDTMRLK